MGNSCDKQGKDDLEKNTSRPPENSSGASPVQRVVDETSKKVDDVLKKK